ncbi:MAG: N-acetylmuramoyl-L-alanine amidase [Limnochordales bacterium]|nr:N-acetylmuramoyl-L-alanine amidase [Limnochordales bacterium]
MSHPARRLLLGRSHAVFFIVIHKRLLYLPFLLLFAAVSLYAMRWQQAMRTATLMADAGVLRQRTIAVDPGHGGPDPGAKRGGLVEKDVVLDIALRLERLLLQAGAEPLLTRRSDDEFTDGERISGNKKKELSHRAEMANRINAQIFLSVHANAFPESKWHGAQVFYQRGSEEGRRLAEAIQAELVRMLPPNRRRALAGDFRVLRETKMPAVIVEVGFLSNPQEAARLADPNYRQRLAEAIFSGLIRYYRGIPSPPAAS